MPNYIFNRTSSGDIYAIDADTLIPRGMAGFADAQQVEAKVRGGKTVVRQTQNTAPESEVLISALVVSPVVDFVSPDTGLTYRGAQIALDGVHTLRGECNDADYKDAPDFVEVRIRCSAATIENIQEDENYIVKEAKEITIKKDEAG